ncbi:MAG: AMP-dependent synthetase [Nocardioides sp.]|nr:AMP-dependent synthetase [Nocardioides sp.]
MEVAGEPRAVVEALRGWFAGDGTERLVVATSGSSGRPKRVVLPRAAVEASVAASHRRVGGDGRWVLRLPATYVAGVQVLSRALLAGTEPVLDEEPWPDDSGWCTSLVPTQLHRVLTGSGAGETDAAADLAALRRAHVVLLGGGPVDPALRRAATDAGVRVVATYGAAETAGGCVYDGVPLDGVALATGERGRVRVAGPTLFEGYDGDPALTAETLVDGWYLTGDAGRLDEDGRLQVLGRLDDVVVSGGVNVPGPAVAARLRAHPGVEAAEVVGVPDPEWGNRLVAFVVGEAAHDVAALRAWVVAEHPRAWAPRQVVALDDVPLLPNGKPDRVRLRELAGEA